MPVLNSLAGSTGIKLGPVMFETLLKHYFERVGGPSQDVVQLRKDEILYDEAFNVVKTFLDVSSRHTVEELQAFSNAKTPSPPWVHLVRLAIPMSSCDLAAEYLIKALGGAEVCHRVVGGTKWWQVRGLRGIDAEWITAKKDWVEAKRRYKAKTERSNSGPPDVPQSPPQSPGTPNDAPETEGMYRSDMDAMRCILYSHGGGYYFGSVDQERYAIQRLARKINGRVFAVNYRLAPQYPFPCAIQDVLAAYLYLIRPPADASHTPVKPEHITLAGDSAGGGLTLALLQVLRDSGLPLPAGAILVSPWCELTHSFPSIHTNTATDIIPQYGLSMHKPSTLWPPPSDELTHNVQSKIRSRIRQLARMDSSSSSPAPTSGLPHTSTSNGNGESQKKNEEEVSKLKNVAHHQAGTNGQPVPDVPEDGQQVDVGTTARMPAAMAESAPRTTDTAVPSAGPGAQPHVVRMTAKDGSEIRIDSQIQLYVSNDLVVHPLVSPALSYLGGLPPMLFIIGDKEVLRDEGIYTAHRAANPADYPIRQEQREMYPALKGIEERYGPSKVHLQVYDDCPHVLPILFSFTTPAKFQYRAMATFVRHVTGLPSRSIVPSLPSEAPSSPSRELFSGFGQSFNLRLDSARSGSRDGSLGRRTSFKGFLHRASSTTAVSPSPGPHPTEGTPASPSAVSDDGSKPVTRRSASLNAARSVFRTSSYRPHPPVRPDLPNHISEASEGETPQSSPMPNMLSAILVETPHTSPSMAAKEIEPDIVAGQDISPPPTASKIFIPDSPQSPHSPVAVQSPTPIDWPHTPTSPAPQKKPSGSSDVAGPRFEPARQSTGPIELPQAGDPTIYDDPESTWAGMIRERVSTRGVIRPLEPPSELGAMTLPPELIGVVSELAARRYIDGRTKYDQKFRREIKAIHKQREKNLDAARKDSSNAKTMAQLQTALFQDSDDKGHFLDELKHPSSPKSGKTLRDGLSSAGSLTWAWALDEERPPPSSIVARRDTREARALARIADSVAEPEHTMSGNNLWRLMTTFLTLGPETSKEDAGDRLRTLDEDAATQEPFEGKRKASTSERLKLKLGLSSH